MKGADRNIYGRYHDLEEVKKDSDIMDCRVHRSSTYKSVKSDKLGEAVEPEHVCEDSECEENNENLNTEEDETEFEEALNLGAIEKSNSEFIQTGDIEWVKQIKELDLMKKEEEKE